MRPEDVLFAQADLLDRLMTNPDFESIMIQTLAASGNRDMVTPAMSDSNARTIFRAMKSHVKAAYAYRVTPDMSLLVQQVAQSFDDSDLLMLDMAPTDCGLVRFDRPLSIRDARGKMMKIHWITWGRLSGSDRTGRTMPGIFTGHFNDTTDTTYRDEITEQLHVEFPRWREFAGQWGFIGGSQVYNAMPIGPAQTPLSATQTAQILADGDTPTDFTNVDRYLHALWFLLNQSITVVEDEHVRKTVRKMVGRRGIPDRVSVIRLRRTEGSRSEGESLVEWSHRWLVRNHLRWQPRGARSRADHDHQYGEIQVEAGHSVRYCTVPGCDASLVRLLIHAYIKGPEGAPLIITDKVYDLAR